MNWEKGAKNGICINFHSNGQKLEEGTYKSGRYDGLWIVWDEKGNKISQRQWKNGKASGLSVEWNNLGNRIGIWSFSSGVLEIKKTLQLMSELVQTNQKVLGTEHSDMALSYNYLGLFFWFINS